MRMIAFAGAAWLLCATATAAWAGQDAAGAGLQASTGFSASPATDKVYPPLPTLAMLPPTDSEDDDGPAPRPSSHKKKLRQHDSRPVGPTARLVVSDASRSYLKDIEHQLDVALAH
ncbi:hypothetical protein B0G62_10535 [Paraburkholderia eburnea]|uniref:Uncharacterized protein n=2 Tax=Paraburkholderia eburnea TaxID=1189126 RepID=A0A2S4MC48_9BURK|nr:hypothetical protein [Paraburkholderia eburnea]POR52067.1 hypothetical protein B0G62_10535 [Paraburkholderia eburnea]PRZ22958.1 hypothetical protein BX588_10535 [Paraburkholderia eburnea]